jgi:hypothetical protein
MIKGGVMTKKLFWVIVCILFPVMAEGAEWVKVSESVNATAIYYVDINSIKQSTPNQYQAWFKVEYNALLKVKEAKSFALFDCAEKKYKVLQATYKTVGGIDTIKEQDWEYAVPESNMENILNFVCTYKKGVLTIPKREHE